MSQKQAKAKTKLTAKDLSKKNIPATKESTHMMAWLLVLVFILPVIYSNETADPALSIRYMVLCIFNFAFLLYFFLFKKQPLPAFNPGLLKVVFLAGLAFSLWNIVAMLSAINTRESFFEASRSFSNLLFLAIVSVIVCTEYAALPRLCKALVLMAIFQSLVGIFQYYGIAFSNLPGNFSPYGLMTNRNLFGSAEMLLMPFCIYTFFNASKGWRYVSGFAMWLLTISILLSQTRSAWLASIVIVCSCGLLVSMYAPAYRKKWLLATLTGIAIAAVTVFLFVAADSGGTLTQSLKERSSIPARTLAGNENAATNTANERLVIWQKSQRLAWDHAITGVGPGNWKIGIQAYGNEGLVNAYGNYILDHAHNIYLQLAAETGLPGLLFFAAGWITVILMGFRMLRRANANERVTCIVFLSGMLGFAIDGFFSFPAERIEHSFYLALMGGIVIGMYWRSQPPVLRPTRRNYFSGPALILSLLLFIISRGRFEFDKHFYNLKGYEKSNQLAKVIGEAKLSRSAFAALDLNGDPAEMYSSIAYKDLKQYDKALAEIGIAKKLHPYNARIYNTAGTIYTESQNFPAAIREYEKALSFTSKNEVVLKNLAVNYYNVKAYAKCLAILKQIDIKKDPLLRDLQKSALLQMTSSTK